MADSATKGFFPDQFPRWLALTWLIAMPALVAGGVSFYLVQEAIVRRDVESNLDAIAQLKVNQIVQWRKERLDDASLMTASTFLVKGFLDWVESRDPRMRDQVLDRMRASCLYLPYSDVLLVDASGQILLSVSGREDPYLEPHLSAALHAARPMLTDLRTDPGESSVHVDVIAPIVKEESGKNEVIGAIILESNAEQFLYPMLQTWPGNSSTAETTLYRRDGDSVLFLNQLRHQRDAALKLRVPLSRTEVPAVRAVLGGEGVIHGPDYRGVPVLAVVKAIPNSSWFLTAKMDRKEAFSIWRFQGVIILTLLLGMVLLGTAGGGLLWRQQVSLQRYTRGLIEATLDPMVTISPEGRITDVNLATERATGLSRKELIGTEFSDYFTEPDRAREGYREAFAKGQEQDYPLELKRGDGSLMSVLYNTSVYRDGRGRVAGVLAAARDISERKNTERNLQLSEERFRSLILATAQIVWTTDAEGNVEDMPAWRAFTGQSIEEVRGARWTEALHSDDRARTLAVWQDSVKRRSLYDTEYRVRRHDGQYRYFAARGVPLLDEDGSIREWIGYCADIHDRKLAEEEINRLNAELEQRVLERTAQLQAANKELEAFAYSVSHDLRAPLRAIDGFTRILREDFEPKLDAEGTRICSIISENTNKMGQLIDDLLAFSRLGRVEIRHSLTDMGALVKAVFRELSTPKERERIDFLVEPIPEAICDQSLIRQAWSNLIANAIKFSSKRERAVIRVRGELADGEVIYTVEDNGAGFDMRYVDKLFGIFERLHSTREFEGTGVGLAIVQRVIHRHGGRL
ncbi:MAG: Adaptive-response sensory-kinase SasA [bacterium]|nr:Adaptive-response sensory-kinase SasA [bacterium]